jgi:hypothetical protein
MPYRPPWITVKVVLLLPVFHFWLVAGCTDIQDRLDLPSEDVVEA